MGKKLLTIRQAMAHFNVMESLLKELISNGTLQSYKKGNITKIDVDEMNEWIDNLSDNELHDLSRNKNKKRFTDYFKPSYVLLDFKAENKFEAISEMAGKAKSLGLVKDNRWLYDVLIAREELYSTAIGKGIAMLHPRNHHPAKLKHPAIVFGRSKAKIDFDALDGEPIKIYFLLLLHDDVQHLFSMAYITKFLLDEENLEKLLNAKTSHDIVELLR